MERRHAETELHQQRQQERQRTGADPEDEPAHDAGPEGRKPKQRQVDHRRRHAARAHDISGSGQRAARDESDGDAGRDQSDARHRQAEGESADAEPDQRQA